MVVDESYRRAIFDAVAGYYNTYVSMTKALLKWLSGIKHDGEKYVMVLTCSDDEIKD